MHAEKNTSPPNNLFRNCLPDCSTVIYSFTQSSAPFRRCDSRNLNLSPLCDLASQTKPQAWAKEVKEVYNIDRSAIVNMGGPGKRHLDKLLALQAS